MSEEELDPKEMPKRVRVLAARVSGDAEHDSSGRWFKRYMRPYLVAAGIDFRITQATATGGLGRSLVNEFKAKRIVEAGGTAGNAAASALGPTEERDAALELSEQKGGIILMGRDALKEYFWALKKGYGEEIDLREEARLEGLGLGAGERRSDAKFERFEEIVVKELDKEDATNPKAPFEEVDEVAQRLNAIANEEDDSPSTSSGVVGGLKPLGYAPYRIPPPSASAIKSAPSESDLQPLTLAPRQLPPQPPLLLVPFYRRFGVVTWPSSILGFFNHRADVKLGAEYAMMILNQNLRPFAPPTSRNSLGELENTLDLNLVEEVRLGGHRELGMAEEGTPTGSPDLDFMIEKEEPGMFRKSDRKLPHDQEYHRRHYYTEELPPALKQARELASGERPATKAETANPPKIESELRKQRLEKEVRWRHELQGWAVRRSGSGVAWDESWGNSLGNESVFKVFEGLKDEDWKRMEEGKQRVEVEKAARVAAWEALA
ncbi:mitochondrial import inner membrane translocase subunit TIM54 [Pseudohyphozyma bogoriensis]|nr:mitochondrial import inner membrane translocase subunit TIM54 [Pseudohyphozyma bogoriensis]